MRISEEMKAELDRISNNVEMIEADKLSGLGLGEGWEVEEVTLIKSSLHKLGKLVVKVKFLEEMVERHVAPQVVDSEKSTE